MSNRTSASAPVHTVGRRASTLRASIPGRLSNHAALLAGVSMAALLVAGSPAHARPLGNGRAALPAVTTAIDAASVGAQQAAAMAQQSMNSLNRAAQAIQAMRNVQAAARSAAAPAAGVPNGLAGLVQDPRIAAGTPNLWVNASNPVETKNGGQTTVTIQQSASRAVLTWQKFDVGAQTTLVYDQQGNRDWIALNRIDATGAPSRIAGQIKADGTVLIMNPNGIIFTGTSQINVNSLIATTHDIRTTAAASAFANNGEAGTPNYVQPTGQNFFVPPNEDAANRFFLDNGLFTLGDSTARTGNSVVFGMGDQTLGSPGGGIIQVQAGAILNANVSGSNDGGYLALMAPKVINAGTLTTRNGSINLLAGNTGILSEPVTTATGTAANIIGRLVYPGGSVPAPLPINSPAIPGGGVVVNDTNALLVARTGAVTMIGENLQQLGGIDVTTGVSRPGSIGLYGGAGPNSGDGATGRMTLGSNSVLSIMPEQDGSTVPTGAVKGDYFATSLQPQITIASPSIVIPDGMLIKAPSARLALLASGNGGAGAADAQGNIVLETGSVIDLSGLTGVTLPMSSNLISLLVTPNEIADYPLASALVGKTVILDARLHGTRADGTSWVGSPIVNAAGYADSIPMSIDQLLTAAGSLDARGWTVIQKPGSVVNVSGGYVSYTGGIVNTTRLRGSDGRSYDIGDPNLPLSLAYTVANGFTVDHARWNVTETYLSPLAKRGHYEPGYIAGRSAGSLSVTAANPILAGSIVGDIVTGRRQRALAQGGGTQTQTTLDQLPTGAALNVTFGLRGNEGYVVQLQSSPTTADPYDLASFAPTTAQWMPHLGGDVFPIFTDVLNSTGFSSIAISGAYDLSMATGANLTVRPGGSITLKNVTTIDGTLRAPGGTINLAGYDPISASEAINNTIYVVPPTAAVVIGPHAVLDVRGLWVNDTNALDDRMQGAAFIDGGSVSVTTSKHSVVLDPDALIAGSPDQHITIARDVTQGIVLASGSVIDVSSGGYIDTTGRFKTQSDGSTAGKGGNLTLLTYTGEWDASAISSRVVAPTDLVVTDRTVLNTPGDRVYGTIAAGTLYYFGGPPVGGTAITNRIPSSALGPDYAPDHGNIVLGGTVYSTGFAGGGKLSLQAPTVRIAGDATTVTGYARPSVIDDLASQSTSRLGVSAATAASWFSAGGAAGSATAAGTLVVPASLFADNGFSSYSLTSTSGGLTVTAGTIVAPTQVNYLASPTAIAEPTGTPVRAFAQSGRLPDGLRKPVSLTFTASVYGTDTDASSHGFLLDAGASLIAEPQGSVSISSQSLTRILGNIIAPSGNVDISASKYSVNGIDTLGGLWIGSEAVLDVSGTFVRNPRILTYRTGTALDAGTITLSSPLTVVQEGAQLLLRGASAVIDVPAGGSLGRSLGSQMIWSDGGNLRLAGQINAPSDSLLYFGGAVDASGGTAQAAGGTLTLGGVERASANQFVDGPFNIVIEPENVNIVAAFDAAPTSITAIRAKIPTLSTGVAVKGTAFIGAQLLSDSGFENVSLTAPGNIAFVGSVNVRVPGTLTLQSSKGSIVLLPVASGLLPADLLDNPIAPGIPDLPGYAAGASIGQPTVNLEAGYVRLVGADANGSPVTTLSRSDGTFNVSAQWIDLQRSLAIDNAASVSLTSAAAIRALPDNYGFETLTQTSPRTSFGGALYVGGNLTLAAAEIFPATNTHFLIESTGTTAGFNTITIRQNGTPTAPLSAGGGLYIDAQNIVQGGTLWAPLGTVVLGLTDLAQLPDAITGLSGDAVVTPTISVTLGAGSLTSVSAAGLTVPYGQTIDGTAWYAGSYGVGSPEITAPPGKQIGFNTANLDQQAGAVLDISGGGEVYATEYIKGVGGSRNVLTTYQVTPDNSNQGFTTSTQYADGRQVYALVPSYLAPVAAYDSTFATSPYFSGGTIGAPATSGGQATLTGIAPGTAVYLDGSNGIPAGTYTLLPGMYATLPGAYRVVQVASNLSPSLPLRTAGSADGSQFVSGHLTNAITGKREATTSVFQLQSNDVWTRYSRIDIATGNKYFTDRANADGVVVPRLPIDGGLASIGATSSLSLLGTILAAPAPGGRGGVLSIYADNILVKSATRDTPASSAGYLVLDADQLSNSGAGQIVIGGQVSFQAPGSGANDVGKQIIDAVATHLEILTDEAHPLTGSSLVLVSRDGGLGITIDEGSVISSRGAASAVDDTPIVATASASGNRGSLLRVSAGGLVDITRAGFTLASDPAITGGAITIGTNPGTATLAGVGAPTTIDTAALSIDTSGSLSFGGNVVLRAQEYDIAGPVISLGNTAGLTGGVRLSATDFARFAGVRALRLRSATVFNVYDAGGAVLGDALNRIGSLTFDGAGFAHQGGQATIHAQDIVLTNSRGSTSTVGALGGTGGTLSLDAVGTLTAEAGTSRFAGFGGVTLSGANGIAFAAAGGIDAGSADVVLAAPALVVRAAADQSLVTTGGISIQSLAGAMPSVATADIGGSLALTGGRIADGGTIIARSGKVSLTATSGDVELSGNALIDATGSAQTVLDRTTFAPGGTIKLIASNGSVTVGAGTTVDVSAVGPGYAGALTITSADAGTVTLLGTLKAIAEFNDLGGSLSINAGHLVGDLPWSGFTDRFAVTLGHGDLRVTSGTTLTSTMVELTTNDGSVIVDGTIDARASGGGSIKLFGSGVAGAGGTRSGGVAINAGARLDVSHRRDDPANPRYESTSTQIANGGTVTLGTTGTPNGTYNATYGYQNVDPGGSGSVVVAAGATLDLSPGEGGKGGELSVRAPLLTDNTVNVSVNGQVVNASGVVLDAYASWSTADTTTGGKHFDGIIDPAGWFKYRPDGSIVMVNGTWTMMRGLTATGVYTPVFNLTQTNGNLSAAPAGVTPMSGSGYFVPGAGQVVTDHVTFYQTTLVGFVQSLFAANTGTVKATSFGSVDPSLVHLRPEISLVNPRGDVNGGSITVASNWNLGAGTVTNAAAGTANLFYRTSAAKEAGTLTLRALNDVQIRATISDGFFTTAADGKTLVANLAANSIANNPNWTGTASNVLVDTYKRNTTSVANLMVPTIASAGSFSYDFVAGATGLGSAQPGDPIVAPSANPDAVVPSAPSGGNITVDGHTSYINPASANNALYIPTLVRTGTGSISFSAAGDIKWLDALAPGAVYTAGRVADLPADFTAPAFSPGVNTRSWTGIVTQPVWAIDGGMVAFNAGGSIIGIEASTPDRASTGGSQTNVPNGFTGRLWSTWYTSGGKSNGSGTPFSTSAFQQTSAYVNYGSFLQGVGALGGGDVRITADKDVVDLMVSIPESILVHGGRVASSPPQIAYYGGGDLTLRAGRDLTSGALLVGRGNGDVRVGGAVEVTASNPVTGRRTQIFTDDLPLLLAVQDGFIDLTAAGSVTIGGIYDPASTKMGINDSSGVFTSYGVTLPGNAPASGSGVALTSLTGDASVASLSNTTEAGIFGRGLSTMGQLWPARVALSAPNGDVTMNLQIGVFGQWPSLVPSINGGLDILAGRSVNWSGALNMPDPLTTSSQYVGIDFGSLTLGQYISPLGVPLSNLAQPLHIGDTEPAVITAGLDITGDAAVLAFNQTNNLSLIEPALIRAGRNISNFSVVAQNNAANDITSVIAGQDLTGAFTIYGPGDLLLSAGRNMGPFLQSRFDSVGNPVNYGVLAIGDGSNAAPGSNSLGDVEIRRYLPRQSADIHLLFGVGAGVNYAGAIDQYVDPSHAGSTGIDLLTGIAALLGQPRDQAWATFQGLPAARQQLLIQRAFVDFLGQAARDYKDPSSPYFGKYQRAYDAIATLFPASSGYPSDRDGGGGVTTGRLNVALSLVQTQLNSDITILGPSGGIVVGTSGRDILNQNQQGILTSAGGSIGIFTNDDIRVNQSRIMTAQGGDIDIFVANGDIDAGSGPKTLITNPVLSLICGVNGDCHVNPNGLVTGAGIAGLLTVPGQDPTKSNVTLAAPRGIIDLGAAGVRSAGNLVLVATQILNAYNAQVGGITVGMPSAPTVNTGVLVTASNTSAATQQATAAPANTNDRPSIIIVEVVGYGGGDGSTPEPPPSEVYTIKKRQSYNPDSPLQVVGLGAMSNEQQNRLTDDGGEQPKADAPAR